MTLQSFLDFRRAELVEFFDARFGKICWDGTVAWGAGVSEDAVRGWRLRGWTGMLEQLLRIESLAERLGWSQGLLTDADLVEYRVGAVGAFDGEGLDDFQALVLVGTLDIGVQGSAPAYLQVTDDEGDADSTLYNNPQNPPILASSVWLELGITCCSRRS